MQKKNVFNKHQGHKMFIITDTAINETEHKAIFFHMHLTQLFICLLLQYTLYFNHNHIPHMHNTLCFYHLQKSKTKQDFGFKNIYMLD